MKIVLFLSLLLLIFHKSTALKCYTCSATEDDSDTHCVDNLGSKDGDITDCDKKYCYIVLQEYKDPRNKLASMTRGCVDKPTYINQVVEDATHRTYYRSCRSDLCNSGTGRSDNNDINRGAFGDKSTIYCPGTGKGSAVKTGALFSLTFMSIMYSLLMK